MVKSVGYRLWRNWMVALIDPWRIRSYLNLPRYIRDWRRYSRLAGPGVVRWQESYPCLTDWVSYTPFDAHYFYQASWLARKLQETRPPLHVDVGSSVMMVGVTSAIVPTIFVDYRPLRARLTNLTSVAGNILALPFAANSVFSLSCLHVIEHIGLGRYGDPLNPQGSIRAAQELTHVLAPGGHLFLSTPVGRERVQFNAHRIFDPATVRAMFAELELVEFSLVDDNGLFHPHTNLEQASTLAYACGMFDFIKKNVRFNEER